MDELSKLFNYNKTTIILITITIITINTNPESKILCFTLLSLFIFYK